MELSSSFYRNGGFAEFAESCTEKLRPTWQRVCFDVIASETNQSATNVVRDAAAIWVRIPDLDNDLLIIPLDPCGYHNIARPPQPRR